MEEADIRFKTSLIFWKLYETNLYYSNKDIIEILKNSKYANKLYDGYYFENFEGKRMPLKWIAATGHLFVPSCIKIHTDTFKCKDNPDIYGKIQIDIHVYPQGVLVVQAKLDFDEYMKIAQLVIASQPQNVILTDNSDMKSKLDHLAEGLTAFLKTKIKRQSKLTGEKASPWHHNWIWWKTQPDIPISEFDIGGKYFKWALGMCTRSDKWRSIKPENYFKIEDVFNISPYEGNCVYVTHPGNCIIPSDDFTDPNAVKNTLIDVIFAAELGNVQRYLILNHLQAINFRSFEIHEIIQKFEEEDLDLSEAIERLQQLETEINELVFEVSEDLQVSRTPRLIFTSVYKTKIFRQMVQVLHGWDFYENLFDLIDKIKDSLTRQRDIIRMKADETENTFLRNLQIVFIIGLVAQMITLFYAVDINPLSIVAGIVSIVISVMLSLIVLITLRRMR